MDANIEVRRGAAPSKEGTPQQYMLRPWRCRL